MSICRGLLHWILLIVGCPALFGQSPTYTNYSLDNGLPSSTVYGAFQDRYGYIWFCTESGASRYDGKTFDNFDVRAGLSGNDVLSSFEDSRGRIWFLPFNENLSYYEDGKLHNGKTDPWLAKIKGRNFISSHLEDAAGTLWFCDDGSRVFKVFPNNHVEIDSSSIPPQSARSFRYLYLNSDGDVLSGSNSDLFNLSRHQNLGGIVGGNLDKYYPPRLVTISDNFQLCGIKNEFLAIVKDRPRKLRLQGIPMDEEILSLQMDHSQDLWIGTRNGAVWVSDYRLTDSTFEIQAMHRFLEGVAVTSVLEDAEGNYWMTSLGDGVFFFASVSAVTFGMGENNRSLFANEVFVDRQDQVWVGFDGLQLGLYKEGNFTLTEVPFESNGRGRTNAIFEDLAGNVFLLMDNATCIVKPSGERIYFPVGGKAGVQLPNKVYYFSHSWEVDSLGPFQIDEFEAEYRRAWRDVNAVVKKRSLSLLETQEGKLLIGTLEGVLEWDGMHLRKLDFVPSVSISEMDQSPSGTIWISTLSDGVGYLSGDTWHGITRQEGLASDIVHGMCFDDHGIAFVATNQGISRIEPPKRAGDKLQIRNFGKNFGLASDEVRSVAVSHGKVYAGTARGFTVLDEVFLTSIPPKVRVHILTFAVNGRLLDSLSEPISLHHRENQISITFTGISFRNADKLKFAYRLSSNQDGGIWTPTDSRQLEFPSLSSGEYRLEIGAMVDGIPVTRETAAIDFVVQVAPWETTPFRVAAVFLIMLIVALVVLFVVGRVRRQERKRAEINRRIAASEQKALRAQMNPHFIFNCLNSIEDFYIRNRAQEANAFIADFSDLIRSILDLSGKSAISLKDELRFVELFLNLESHRMDHRFQFTLEVETELQDDFVLVPPMIVQPFVENAVWHGISLLEHGSGKISIRVVAVPKGVAITIEDNGIGRAQSEYLKSKYQRKHKSRGMGITTERLELLNIDKAEADRFSIQIHDLQQPDGTAAGTSILIFVPESFNQPNP